MNHVTTIKNGYVQPGYPQFEGRENVTFQYDGIRCWAPDCNEDKEYSSFRNYVWMRYFECSLEDVKRTIKGDFPNVVFGQTFQILHDGDIAIPARIESPGKKLPPVWLILKNSHTMGWPDGLCHAYGR